MMSLDHLPSGNVRARLMVDGARYTATFATEAEAQEWQVVTRARAVGTRVSRPLAVEEHARRWLGEFIDTAADIDRYRRNVQRYIIPCLGEHHLEKVTSLDVAVLLDRASADPSYGIADSVRRTCRELLAVAVEDGLITRSPIED